MVPGKARWEVSVQRGTRMKLRISLATLTILFLLLAPVVTLAAEIIVDQKNTASSDDNALGRG